jgi:hypothetical protein
VTAVAIASKSRYSTTREYIRRDRDESVPQAEPSLARSRRVRTDTQTVATRGSSTGHGAPMLAIVACAHSSHIGDGPSGTDYDNDDDQEANSD